MGISYAVSAYDIASSIKLFTINLASRCIFYDKHFPPATFFFLLYFGVQLVVLQAQMQIFQGLSFTHFDRDYQGSPIDPLSPRGC